jgi:hypothetical protein
MGWGKKNPWWDSLPNMSSWKQWIFVQNNTSKYNGENPKFHLNKINGKMGKKWWSTLRIFSQIWNTNLCLHIENQI